MGMVSRPAVLTAGSLHSFRSKFGQGVERVETAYRTSEQLLEPVRRWAQLLDASLTEEDAAKVYITLVQAEEKGCRELDRARAAYVQLGVLLARIR